MVLGSLYQRGLTLSWEAREDFSEEVTFVL